MAGRWCSAAEVEADVSRAGGGVAPPVPLADACLSWGARPAPLILTEPELALAEESAAPPAAPPDLMGITRMLRMVQTEDTDEDSSPCDIVISKLGRPAAPLPGGVSSTHLNAIDVTADDVMTSDLNPYVEEFVPRSVPRAASGPTDGLVVTVKGAGAGANEPGRAREREELAARLRDDISGAGGRDKCSAIARLMRLYAQPAEVPRLLTPDYFEGAAAPDRGADGDRNGTSSRTADTASERIESVGSHCVSPMISERQHEAEPQEGAESRDVRASVDKVRRWLGDGEREVTFPREPPARASPRLLLAPVTFRSRVPSSPALTPPPPPAPAPAPAAARAYSPPRDTAAALHREYAARAAAAKAALPPPAAADTLWTRLEARLRQKDTELRARGEAEPRARY